MAKFTAPPAGKTFEPVPAGNHIARCIAFIDLGTQEKVWQGTTNLKRRIRITFELPNEKKVFKEEDGEQPCFISQEFTLSFHKSGSFLPMLESWFSESFSKERQESFDPEAEVLGRPAMVNISHSTADGRTYANVQAITPLPAGMDSPAQINPSQYFFMGYVGKKEDFDETAYHMIKSDWVRETIANSPEYKAVNGPVIAGNPNATEVEKEQAAKASTVPEGVNPDDLPFKTPVAEAPAAEAMVDEGNDVDQAMGK